MIRRVARQQSRWTDEPIRFRPRASCDFPTGAKPCRCAAIRQLAIRGGGRIAETSSRSRISGRANRGRMGGFSRAFVGGEWRRSKPRGADEERWSNLTRGPEVGQSSRRAVSKLHGRIRRWGPLTSTPARAILILVTAPIHRGFRVSRARVRILALFCVGVFVGGGLLVSRPWVRPGPSRDAGGHGPIASRPNKRPRPDTALRGVAATFVAPLRAGRTDPEERRGVRSADHPRSRALRTRDQSLDRPAPVSSLHLRC